MPYCLVRWRAEAARGRYTAYSPPVLTPSVMVFLMEGCHAGGPFRTAPTILPSEMQSRDPPCGAGSLFVYGPDRWTVGCALATSCAYVETFCLQFGVK